MDQALPLHAASNLGPQLVHCSFLHPEKLLCHAFSTSTDKLAPTEPRTQLILNTFQAKHLTRSGLTILLKSAQNSKGRTEPEMWLPGRRTCVRCSAKRAPWQEALQVQRLGCKSFENENNIGVAVWVCGWLRTEVVCSYVSTATTTWGRSASSDTFFAVFRPVLLCSKVFEPGFQEHPNEIIHVLSEHCTKFVLAFKPSWHELCLERWSPVVYTYHTHGRKTKRRPRSRQKKTAISLGP